MDKLFKSEGYKASWRLDTGRKVVVTSPPEYEGDGHDMELKVRLRALLERIESLEILERSALVLEACEIMIAAAACLVRGGFAA